MGGFAEVNFSDVAEQARFGRYALFRLLEMLRYKGSLQEKLFYSVTRAEVVFLLRGWARAPGSRRSFQRTCAVPR
jgi:hypothetical protein